MAKNGFKRNSKHLISYEFLLIRGFKKQILYSEIGSLDRACLSPSAGALAATLAPRGVRNNSSWSSVRGSEMLTRRNNNFMAGESVF